MALRVLKAFKLEEAKRPYFKESERYRNRRLPEEINEKLLSLILERYRDFGPTLAHEYFVEKHSLTLSIGSVRNIMIESDIWVSKKKR